MLFNSLRALLNPTLRCTGNDVDSVDRSRRSMTRFCGPLDMFAEKLKIRRHTGDWNFRCGGSIVISKISSSTKGSFVRKEAVHLLFFFHRRNFIENFTFVFSGYW